jgi:hypothetical protein
MIPYPDSKSYLYANSYPAMEPWNSRGFHGGSRGIGPGLREDRHWVRLSHSGHAHPECSLQDVVRSQRVHV